MGISQFIHPAIGMRTGPGRGRRDTRASVCARHPKNEPALNLADSESGKKCYLFDLHIPDRAGNSLSLFYSQGMAWVQGQEEVDAIRGRMSVCEADVRDTPRIKFYWT